MHRNRFLSLRAFFFAALVASPALAGTIYVDASASGANNGTSWANAFQGPSSLQAALAAAASGDEIWVANGTYLPSLAGVRSASFNLKTGVSLYGGFAGGETSLAQRNPAIHATVLSGDLAGNDAGANYSDNSYHILTALSLATVPTVDGFTIRGGNADGPGAAGIGGGFFSQSSNWGPPSVRQCVFESNRCAGKGGAFYLTGGGGMPSFEDCRFRDNHAGVSGGAVQFDNGVDAGSFYRCIFTGNTAPDASAADFFLSFDIFFTNCLIYGNTGGVSVVWAHTESYLWVSDSTVAANDGIALASYADSGIWNSIVYFNDIQLSGFPQASHCCIQGGHPGTAMISDDPLFADVAGANFRLMSSSPCVDSGNNYSTPLTALDLDLTPRREDVPGTPDTGVGTPPIIDRGAYETPATPFESFCAGDGSLPTACPCGNTGQPGHGCSNSAPGSPGALLSVAGDVYPDTVALTASDLRGGVLCIFLQGNAPIGSGVYFGDGVRCAGGALKRIAARNASPGGVVSYPGPTDPSISARSAALGNPIQGGTQRWYQTWYRDSLASFCPPPQGGTSNVTSGIIVSW